MSKIGSGCSSDCMNCGESGCSKRFFDESAKEEKAEEKPEVKAEVEELEIIEITDDDPEEQIEETDKEKEEEKHEA